MKVLNKLEEWVGGTLFLLIFAILVAQVFFRQVLHHPLIWSEEAARLLFVYVGMLGGSIGIRNQQHVLIDFITGLLPGKLRVWIFSLVQLIIFSAILLLFYYGITVFNKASDQLVSLGISDKWLYLSLPVCAVLMLFRFLQAQQENYHKGDSFIPVWVYLVLTVAVLLVAFIEPSWFNALRISEYVKFGKSSVYVALIIWLVIMFAGVPVGWSLFIAAVLFFSMTRWGTGNFAATKLVESVNSFGLLSVPFFILTGILMNSAGITTRIFNFALAMLGHYTGGMGHVNIAASLIFSGMSGSALADAGGLGQLEIKAMRDAGYEDDLCGGITAASCIIGPLVPPSIAMIIYGVIADVSIAKLFLAGFVPGVLLTILLMAMNTIICKKTRLWQSAENVRRRTQTGVQTGVLAAADADTHHRRHLLRRLHPDRSRRCRRPVFHHPRHVHLSRAHPRRTVHLLRGSDGDYRGNGSDGDDRHLLRRHDCPRTGGDAGRKRLHDLCRQYLDGAADD